MTGPEPESAPPLRAGRAPAQGRPPFGQVGAGVEAGAQERQAAGRQRTPGRRPRHRAAAR